MKATQSIRINLIYRTRTRIALGVLFACAAIFLAYGAVLTWPWFQESVSLAAAISMIAALLIGTLLAFSMRHFIEIDPHARRVVRKFGFLYTIEIVAYDTRDISRVELVPHYERDSDGDSYVHHYDLNVLVTESKLLARITDRWVARRVGERVCVGLDVPFDNQVFEVSSVRTSEELNMSLIERLRSASELSFRNLTLQHDTEIEVLDVEDASVITFPAPTRGLKFMIGLALFFVLFGGLIMIIADDATTVVVLGFFGSILVCLMIGCFAFVGRSSVVIRRDTVTSQQGRFPYRWSINSHEIEELILTDDHVYLVTDSKAIGILMPEKKSDVEFMKGFIARELLRRCG